MLCDIESAEKAVNADCSRACGGHISVSSRLLTPRELCLRLANFWPSLFAIYAPRLRSSYVGFRKPGDIGDRGPVSVRSHCLELRIFPAVKSVECLTRRLKLVRYMLEKCSVSNYTARQAKHDFDDGIIREIFDDIYSDPLWKQKSELRDDFADWFVDDNLSETLRQFQRSSY